VQARVQLVVDLAVLGQPDGMRDPLRAEVDGFSRKRSVKGRPGLWTPIRIRRCAVGSAIANRLPPRSNSSDSLSHAPRE